MSHQPASPPDPEPGLLHRSLLSRPLEVVSASGSHLHLRDGRRILDACAGAAVAVIGHGDPSVQHAVAEQMSRVSYVHTVTYTTASAETLGDVMVARGKEFGMRRAHFLGSGSEAMDAALKMARQFFVEKGEPQRNRFVSRRQGYHGNTIGSMSVSSNLPRKVPYQGALLLEGVSFVSDANEYRGRKHDETSGEYAQRLVAELDDEFRRLGPETVIAFVAETIVGATSGCTPAPRGYFAGVRALCDRYGVLLILDEVMCGAGRTGTYFAFEQENTAPDIVTVGKGVGGGYVPIAGMLVNEKVVGGLRGGTGCFNHGQTYQAHPLSCAAALAVQHVIQEQDLVSRSATLGVELEALLRDAFGECRFVGNIRGRGLFWGLEFVNDRETKEPLDPGLDFNGRVVAKAFELGVAVYPGKGTIDGTVGDHVIIAPPLNIEEDDLRRSVSLLKEAYLLAEAEVVAQGVK